MAQANPGDRGSSAATEAVPEEKAGAGGGGGSSSTRRRRSSCRVHTYAASMAPLSTGFFHPWYGFMGSNASDWFRLMGQDHLRLFSDGVSSDSTSSKNICFDYPLQKIVKQVEYQLSNANLLANDSLMKLMSKDPEGFVPISAITSLKKMKPWAATTGCSPQLSGPQRNLL